MFYELGGKVRYLTGIRGYLRASLTPGEAREIVARELARREESFLRLARLGIYANPNSAFRKLLLAAGIDFDALDRLVRQLGLEEAVNRLYEAGVYLSYDELKRRQPVKRPGLEFRVDPRSLDNPLLVGQYEVQSSGSRGAGSRSFTDLTLLAHEGAYYCLLLDAHGVRGRPVAIWGPEPPSFWGVNSWLRHAKAGNPPQRWFTPTRTQRRWERVRGSFVVLYTLAIARTAGKRFPWPRFVSQDQPLPIASWLAEMKARGQPALLDTSASSATRVALLAKERGLDIAGTVFRTGGEPLTPAKAAAIAAAGGRAINGYAATELGVAGLGCAAPSELDDLHLVTDKVVVQARDKQVGEAGASVPALFFTTVLLNCRKVLINAESGDYGRLEVRDCGCPLGEVGFSTHVLGLHGYDKLTSTGVSFQGSDLYDLVEQVLPARFGGDPLDYQLAEEEDEHGVPRVDIVIAPRVGTVDEDEVVETILKALSGYDRRDRGPLMASQWRQTGTLRVVRREPYAAGGRKVLPLHILDATAARAAPEVGR